MNAVNHDYDAFMTTMGAVLDLEDCRKRVFCTTCTLIKDIIPGSSSAFVVADPFFPEYVKQSQNYLVAKRIFFHGDNKKCEETYRCQLD